MFDTENSVLLYYRNKNQENSLIMPTFDFDIVFADKITIYLHKMIEDIGSKLDLFILDVTNDPKTYLPFGITNLGYYSIQVQGNFCDCYYYNDKTLLVFKREDVNIHYNLNTYLPNQNGTTLNNIFHLNKGITSFKFKNCNYKIDCSIWKEGYLIDFWIDLLNIENNYKFKSKKQIEYLDCLKEKEVI
jgi:hypothetical protein